MGRIEVVTEKEYLEGESDLPFGVYIYDAVTYGDLDSNIERQLKEAGDKIIVVKVKETY